MLHCLLLSLNELSSEVDRGSFRSPSMNRCYQEIFTSFIDELFGVSCFVLWMIVIEVLSIM